MGQCVAYEILLNSCSKTHLPKPKMFHLILKLGRTCAMQCDGSPLIALYSISLQEVTLRMGHTHDRIHFELNKVL